MNNINLDTRKELIGQGIYSITNIATKEVYIGSTINLKKRIHQHFNDLSRNDHDNKNLQKSYNKYGSEFFVFDVLEHYENIERDFLFERENIYIKKYKDNMFNMSLDAKCVKGVQLKHTPESKKKISLKSLANWQDPDYLRKMESRIHTEETKAKMSDAHKGKKYSLGYKHDDEFGAKISERMTKNNPFKGQKHTEETRKKMSEWQKTRPAPSEETRQKLREAALKRWNKNKELNKN